MSKLYVFPAINGRKLYYSHGLDLDERTAKISFYLLEDNIDLFREILASNNVEVGYIVGDSDIIYSLFSSARPQITKLTSNLDEFTYVEITFTKD